MKKIVATLTIILIFLLASMTAVGGYIVYESTSNSTQSTARSDLKLKINVDGAELEATNIAPGIIMFIFGSIGLILMLFKIPTYEVLGYRTKGGGGGNMGFMVKEKIISEETIRTPLLIWWLLKRTGKLEKIEGNASQFVQNGRCKKMHSLLTQAFGPK